MATEFKPLGAIPGGTSSDVPPGAIGGGRKRGRPKGSGGRPRKSLQKEIEGLLAVLNAVIRPLAPRDALDSVEVAALAKSLDEQAKRSPRFRRGLEALLATTGGTSLGVVIGIIIGRRAARHNLFGVPRYVDDIGGSVIQMMNVSPSEADEAMAGIVAMMGLGGATNGMGTNDDTTGQSD